MPCAAVRLQGLRKSTLSNISNKTKSVSSDIQTLRRRLNKRGAGDFFKPKIQSDWISDETLFRAFDIAAQGIDNSWRISKQSSPKFMITRITYKYPNLLHGYVVIFFVFSS